MIYPFEFVTFSAKSIIILGRTRLLLVERVTFDEFKEVTLDKGKYSASLILQLL